MAERIMQEERGTVFNIQKFSIHDGPGIRTIVFLKGCPLSCLWCSNPESQQTASVVMLNKKNCIQCRKCQKVCGKQAINYQLSGYINRDLCVNCGKCAQVCPSKALVLTGIEMTVSEVIAELKKDAVQYRRSKGGITLSGGEPLLQANFSAAILKASRQHGWHTAIETTGYGSEASLSTVIPNVDLVLLDIKNIDSLLHKQFTGVENQVILKNALKIAEIANEVIIRVPVIPSFNANPQSIQLICEFAKYLKGVKEIHLLPYHKLGVSKYESLGRIFTMDENLKSPTPIEMNEYKSIVEEQGFYCVIGGQ